MAEPITAEELRSLLSYDPISGSFTWLVSLTNSIKPGMSAGSVNKKGYVIVGVLGRYYKSHRLAWLYMTGEWPSDQVDHRDTDKGNNAWGNLRLANTSQNKANMGAQRRNASGFKGVTRLKNRTGRLCGGWRAQIRVGYKLHHLGTFATPEAASAAYEEASLKHFGEFARAA